MKINLSKLLSAAIVGVIFGLRISHDYQKWNQMGRAAFLEHEAHRFDRYMAAPHSVAVIVGGVLAALVAVGVYELISWGLSKIIKPAAD